MFKRQEILEEYYYDGHVHTPFGRKIKTTDHKALNYLIQSTTSDRVLEKAVVIDKMLEGKKSFISHIIHDEIVIDLHLDDKHLTPEIKKIFCETMFGEYMVNLKGGQNYFDLKELNL